MSLEDELSYYRKMRSAGGKKLSSSIKHDLPEWAIALFVKASDDLRRLSQVVFLSRRGLKVLTTSPNILQILTDLDEPGAPSIVPEDLMRQAKEEAELARLEVESRYPLLNGWAVVSLWALLEAVVREYVAYYIMHHREVWQLDSLSKVRVRVAEYESLPRFEQSLYLAECLETDSTVDRVRSKGKFEAVLGLFGLDGDVPKELHKLLTELNNVRNAIVHRNSTADRRLIRACPWLKVKAGKALQIDSSVLKRYFACVSFYIVLMVIRTKRKFGKDVSTDLSDFELQFQKEMVVHSSKSPRRAL